MRSAIPCMLIGLLALVRVVFAGDVKVGPFTVDVPSSFVGPTRAMPDANSEIVIYSAPKKPDEPANVIQFTRFSLGAPLQNADENIYADGAKTYLSQMLQGIERRRTEYVQSPSQRIHVAIHEGARASWSGRVNGMPTNGIMYCVIIGSDAWFIHMFGPGERPDSELQSVMSVVSAAIK